MVSGKISYWQIFRLIFVLFSLYLLADVFYRWGGFRYYASFSAFLPSVALIIILWSIVAALTALLVWLPVRIIEWFSMRKGWRVRAGHLLLFMGIFVLSGAMVWIGKRLIFSYVPMTFQLQQAVFVCVTLSAIFLTWLFRNKAVRWMYVIQDQITLQVWLFGILAILSVPLVAYHTWGKQTDNVVPKKIAQSPVTANIRPNIILVTFDALTARDMSVYGYERPTTPFITEWAKTAALFTKTETEGNNTASTTASLMTGKRLWTHQTYHLDTASKPVRSNIENLPLALKNNGYYNIAFIVSLNASVKALGISDSFNIAKSLYDLAMYYNLRDVSAFLYRLFGNKILLYDWILKDDFIISKLIGKISKDFTSTVVPPEEAFNRLLRVIDDKPPEPFFAWVHLLPPHDPYLPPEPFMGMFNSSSKLRTYKSQERVWKGKERTREFKVEEQADIDIMRSRYDEFIRYCDKEFEDFIEQLTKMKKLKNTVIILSSDHGHSFEHHYLGHGGPHLYEQVTNIPLIIKEPDETKGRIINNLVEQLDIPPTILDLAGIPAPSWMEGRSLLPLMRGGKISKKPAFSMNFQKNPSRGHLITKGTIAVWEGDYKLIHYLEENKSLLFNLKEDPEELNNLFSREPEAGQRLLTLIQDNLKKANEKISSGKMD